MSREGYTPEPITRRICEAIKRQIASGLLAPGARLPSTRSLAVEWGVSRTTVTAAYEQLSAEGYLETRQGARAEVAQSLGRSSAQRGQAVPPKGPERLSAFGQRLAGFALPPVTGTELLVADFRYGDVASADFPLLAWKKALTGALLRRRTRLRYGDPRGSPDLRAAMQGYLWRARGLRCELEQIIVVNGSQQGLDLCARLLLDDGDRVVMEDPGYNLARQIFLAVGAEVIPVAVDREGMRTEGLPAARLAYTTPSHQFPLGDVLSAGRRRELLAWAQGNGAYVIEDDYDSEYRFDIAPIPSLQALDDAGRVIYLGTASKTLSPTLRLGYLVVPAALAPAFAKAKRLADRHTASVEQEALAALIEGGGYERHGRRIRRRNAERRAALLSAFGRSLPGAVTLTGTEAGLHIVAWLNGIPRAAEEEFVSRAADAGLGIYPITPLYDPAGRAPRPDCAGFVLGYAALTVASIEKGVALLAELVRSHDQG
ncbi:MAG: PLP-dependent aminotransferase family protein [Alphaproteobacteria bacterium]|nr:PLP-dependent aminotransferase family protein [Alphaproteobacteria bacterium]